MQPDFWEKISSAFSTLSALGLLQGEPSWSQRNFLQFSLLCSNFEELRVTSKQDNLAAKAPPLAHIRSTRDPKGRERPCVGVGKSLPDFGGLGKRIFCRPSRPHAELTGMSPSALNRTSGFRVGLPTPTTACLPGWHDTDMKLHLKISKAFRHVSHPSLSHVTGAVGLPALDLSQEPRAYLGVL